MKNAIQLKKVFAVILSISMAGILFVGLGCDKDAGFGELPEVELEGVEPTMEGETGVETEPAVAADEIVYVIEGGTGDGTKISPMGDINGAMILAKTRSTPEVHVAQGSYPVNSSEGTQIKLVDGIKLLGGYSTDFAQRDPSNYISIIKDECTSGGTSDDRCHAVKAGTGITKSSVIDGFNIIGGSGQHTLGVLIHAGAAPIISHNIIDGGSATSFYSGISVMDSTPIIDSNTINAGNGSDESCAIHNEKSSSKIFNNVIFGGEGQMGIGIIDTEESSSLIYNNTIYVGNVPTVCYGIQISISSPKIKNNIIFSTSCGGNSYGIYAVDSSPAEVKNNDVYEFPTALYYNQGSLLKAVCDGNFADNCPGMIILADPPATGNVSEDPKLKSADDFHLTSDSPQSVRKGGLDLSDEIEAVDKDGKPRTVPWSMGAYEYSEMMQISPIQQIQTINPQN